MPLLCISLLALLLLPSSLSCNSTRPAEDIHDEYITIVHVDLDNARRNITTLLQNVTCQEYNLPNCTSENISLVSILSRLTCRMKHLRIPHTKILTASVLDSIRCSCERPTKDPKGKRTATRQRRIKKLCKAKAMISNMTECYQILNAQLPKT